MPSEVLTVRKKHGKPYLVVRYIPSMRVIILPYSSIKACWPLVCITRRKVDSECSGDVMSFEHPVISAVVVINAVFDIHPKCTIMVAISIEIIREVYCI